MQGDRKNVQVPALEAVKFVQRPNGIIKGYAANTYHGLAKDYNEDRVSIIMNITKPQYKGRWPKCSYFAVFDGHGGHTCSDFLKDNMHKYITENQFFPLEPIQALKAGFKKAESEFLKLAESKSIVDRSGSCALVVLIIDNMCYIANVGDSRAVLSYQFGSKVFPLSHDHKPDRTSEKDRILGAGGKIYQSVLKSKAGTSIPGPYRLLPGKLSVSRSFGDIEAKLQKYGGNCKVLIAKPEITYFQIDTKCHDFIVMGSDGIFDKMTNQEIVSVFWHLNYQHKSQKKEQGYQFIGEASSKILMSAMAHLSMDNITSLIIKFEDQDRMERKNHFIHEEISRKQQNINSLNTEEVKKSHRGFSAKLFEKMNLKRKTAESTNVSQKESKTFLEPHKKSMKHLRKEQTMKGIHSNKSEMKDMKENKNSDFVKLLKSKNIEKIR